MEGFLLLYIKNISNHVVSVWYQGILGSVKVKEKIQLQFLTQGLS